jgi:polyhydroxyalkanoate synthase subunit PhaC
MKNNTSAKDKITENQPKLPLDPIAFSQAMLDAYERAKPLLEEFLKKTGQDLASQNFDPFNIQPVYREFMEKLAKDPDKFFELQAGFWQDWMRLWQESSKKFLGEKAETVIEPEKGDRRFKGQEWQESARFDFIKQSYLITCRWMDRTVRDSTDLDDLKKDKLAFYTRVFAEALSPSNFVLTNPEVLKATIDTGGENLVKGFQNLIHDLERGHGDLKISTTDYKAFKLGENIAVTPGKVVHQNELMQLIQYEPATGKVFKRPLLIIPPWINKYYILDLKPENSFVRWLVEQGHTVFMVSWVNPDSDLSGKRFENYMEEGILEPLAKVRDITGEPDANLIGYCLGGTLLAVTLSYLKEKKREEEIASATFLTTLLDFEDSGDLRLFMDDGQLAVMDKEMAEHGVLDARKLQQTFSILRSSDMIWSFVVNNYLLGREPFPFDLLYWNDDSTNMPAAMHSFYLRSMYRDNLLTKPGGIKMDDVPIDITKIETPAYFLSTREDHIAPWKATYDGAKMFSGPVEFTLSASGHIAGVVNPPSKSKYHYWESPPLTSPPYTGGKEGGPDDWVKHARQFDGSWWPHWQKWVEEFTNGQVPARHITGSIEDAPGSYVKVKS